MGTTPSIEPSEVRYATFTARARALVVDSAVLVAVLVLTLFLSEAFDSVPGIGRVVLVVLGFSLFLYEPVFVAWRGATIGHARNRLRVTDAHSNSTPGFPRAFARYALKVVLGLPSFVTMGLTRRHQALHDMLTRTTVRIADGAEAAPYEFQLERTIDDSTLPSRWRRAIVVVLYLLLLFLAVGVASMFAFSRGCVDADTCSASERVGRTVLSIAWLACSGVSIVAGWRGHLPGARRSSMARSEAS